MDKNAEIEQYFALWCRDRTIFRALGKAVPYCGRA